MEVIARELAAAQAHLDSGPDDPLLALIWWMDWHAEAELRGTEVLFSDSARSATVGG